MDLLAALAADPTLLPLWAVMLFAAGMYPIGMMFGCSPCCGPVCKSCCRDEVGQIVVDFSLEATGEQFIRELPITGEFNNAVTVDGKGGAPQFILQGQQSGARVLARAFGNYADDPGNGFISIPPPFGPGFWSRPAPTISPTVALPMGAAFRAEFIDGESVTVTPVGFAPQVVEQPSLTAVVGECPVVYALSVIEGIPGRGLPPVSFSGNPGKWKNPLRSEDPDKYYQGDGMPPVSSLTVDCQGDEGSVVFDVEDHDGRPPGTCDWCNPVVERSMAHPTNRPLDPCDTWDGRYIGFGFAATAEVSDLSVSVPLMAFGKSSAECGSEVVASATMTWGGVAGGSSVRTETYTLNREEQDCIPFSGWTKTSAPPCAQSVRNHITLSAASPAGEGFYGIATKPDNTPGAITETKIISGGSGYAIPGRVAPTVTVSADGGEGADLQVSLEPFTGYYDGLPYWRISSVAIGPGGGGSGYSWWSTLTATVQSPGVQEWSAYLLVGDLDENGAITSVFVYNGGAYYAEGGVMAAPVTISINQETCYSNGAGAVITPTVDIDPQSATYGQITALTLGGENAYVEPTLTLTPPSGGSGAVLEITGYTLRGDGYYGVSGITIKNGGSGYTDFTKVAVTMGQGDEQIAAPLDIRARTGPGGVITSFNFLNLIGQDGWRGAYRKFLPARPGGHNYLARTIGKGACEPGGLYYGPFGACGRPRYQRCPGNYFAIGEFQWRRGCPDYTYEISLQAVEQ